MVKIIVDSTCNLAEEVLQQHDIRVAPISIQFGNDSYEEAININHDLFYSKIEELQIIPTTSQPTPAWFARYYQEIADAGHQVLVITITSEHSGTYQSAMLAKDMAPQADVEVFDSRSISLGTGWMVLEAARLAAAGKARADILARLDHIRDHSHLFLTPATLKYLQMSGRVGKLQGALGSILNLKPIITLKNGVLEAGENVRTRAKAVDRLLDLLEAALGSSDPVNVASIHARVPEEGHDLLDRMRARLNVREALICDLVCSLAVHGGPGVVGVYGYPVG